jgi:hypothetical protein
MDEAGDDGLAKLNEENLNEAEQQVAEQLALRAGISEIAGCNLYCLALGSHLKLVRRMFAPEDNRPPAEAFIADMADADPTFV